MAPVERRLGASWSRRSRMDARLWILAGVLFVIGVAVWVGFVAALPAYSQPDLPWWAYAIAFFAAALSNAKSNARPMV